MSHATIPPPAQKDNEPKKTRNDRVRCVDNTIFPNLKIRTPHHVPPFLIITFVTETTIRQTGSCISKHKPCATKRLAGIK